MPEMLAEPGKGQPAAIGRAVVAYLVQDAENLTLTELSDYYVRRDIAALSRAAERLRAHVKSDPGLAIKDSYSSSTTRANVKMSSLTPFWKGAQKTRTETPSGFFTIA